jgi:predicted permease
VPAVILTHGLWKSQFNGDPNIIGRGVTLTNRPATVVGVLPASFDFRSTFAPGSRVDMLVPFPLNEQTDRWGNTLAIIGRLKPGVSVQQAQSEFDVVTQNIIREHPDRNSFGARLTSLQDQLTGRFRQSLVILLCAVGVVLLIACSNLSNLLLARAASRRKEVAIRSALGASRGRLVKQMLTESLLVSLIGALLGLGLSLVAIQALTSIRDVSIPLLATIRMDATVLLFTVGAAVVTGMLMGIVPALQLSTTHESEALKDSGRGTSEGPKGGWARAAFVVAQLAMACVLLVGAGLLIRSFEKLLDVDMGFRAERAASWRIETGTRYPGMVEQRLFFERLVRRVETVPGVESAGMTDALPLSRDRSWGLGAKGVTYPPGAYPIAHPRVVDRRYAKVMGIPLKAGRFFEERDTAESELVVVINEKAAKRLWPGEDALGKIARFNGDRRVVGIAANVRHETVEQEGSLEAYIPITQAGSNSMELVVRTRLDVNAVASSVQAALREVDPTLPVSEYQTLEGLVNRAVSPRKFLTMLLGAFALSALALASMGIYGVVSYGVGQRTQEIGIRLALGATPGEVRRMVMTQTASLAAIGIAGGVVLAVMLSQVIASLLFGMERGDVTTFAIAVGVLALVSLGAGFLPALRASKLDPMVALRSE